LVASKTCPVSIVDSGSAGPAAAFSLLWKPSAGDAGETQYSAPFSPQVFHVN
jgi:hypothetical protein